MTSAMGATHESTAAGGRVGRSTLASHAQGGLVVAAAVAVLVAAPIVAVFAYAGAPTGGLWQHLADTVLWDYIANTLWLALGVGGLAVIVGTSCAWLVTMHDFPGRRIFEWALVLPLAMPAYVLAYAYTDLLQFTGPLQTALRAATGWRAGEYWLPEIRSTGGAVFVLTAALYPYVYVVARAAFVEQSICVLEVSRTLGCRPAAMFRRVGLPLARPAIATGAAFVVMETLADFGAVKYFEVPTFTTGIYRAWYAYGNPAAASQLASALLLAVFFVLTAERASRGRRGFAHSSTRYRQIRRLPMSGWRAVASTLFCAAPIVVGFLAPALGLVLMAAGTEPIPGARLAELAGNTLLIGALASGATVVVAVLALYGVRRARGRIGRALVGVAQLGYATPGIVIAIGILIAIGTLDRLLAAAGGAALGMSGGLILAGTLGAVLYGCVARFFAVAYGPLDAGVAKIRPSLGDAARTLGASPRRVLLRLYLPLMRGSVLSAGLLVFVDVMKELPATMILRPFNFDTLAIEAFQLATTERLDGAALPSLLIVGAGLLPVILLCRAIGRSRAGDAA